MTTYPDWLSAALAADAAEGQGALPPGIVSSQAGARVIGPARVVLMSRDDNLSVRALLDAPVEAGIVLVAAGGSESRTAMMGGLMALEMQQKGIAGLVTDGLVRDISEIRALGLPVWSRGTSPVQPGKQGPVVKGTPVILGGVVIEDGDVVIADDDGVVIWPQAQIAELLIKAEAKYQQDEARLAKLRER